MLDRAIDSVVSLLTCMHGEEASYPVPEPEDSGFEIVIKGGGEDNLIRSNCKRRDQSWNTVSSDSRT